MEDKKTESKKTFGAYILQRRKELGMTQKELAQKMFVTESAVSKWDQERAARLFPVHGIEVFSMRIYHVSPLWLVIPDAILTALLLIGWFLF